jgi:signal transduction histidine kinase
MALLGVPKKSLLGGPVKGANVFDAPAENIIAQGRIILAAIWLFAASIAPELLAPGYSIGFDLLIAYAVLAIGIVMVRLWRFPGRLAGYAAHAIDIGFLFGLGILTEARATPLFAFSGFFVLLSASVRWDWQGAMTTAVILAFAVWIEAATHSNSGELSGAVTQNLGFIRGIYLIVAGAMLAFSSAVRERRREQLTQLTEWPGPDAAQIDSPSIANMLAHCAGALEVPRVLVLWEETEEPFVNVVMWDNGNYKHTQEMSGSYGDFVRSQQHAELAFWTDDAASTFAATLTGSIPLQSPIIDEGLIRTFAIRSVATAAFAGSSCRGRVFILDRVSWNEFLLRLIQIIASRLANAIDRQLMQSEAKQAAANRERARMTRDLHDGLLQSLTAAGLQIKLLADTESEQTRSRLETVRQLLVAEQRRILDFMRRTSARPERATEVPILGSLQEVLSEAAKQWDCATPLTVEPAEATAPPTVMVHLSLMLAEAVANAVRHGNAANVRISVTKSPQRITVQIRDDGRGFKGGGTFSMDDEQLRSASTGPFSLRERISELGGLLSVDSSPAGVELTIQLPVT